MKKTLTYAVTAFALMTAFVPVNAEASSRSVNSNVKVIGAYGSKENCSLDDIKERLAALGIDEKCINGSIIWSGNCPFNPDNSTTDKDDIESKPGTDNEGNDNNSGNKPDNPEQDTDNETQLKSFSQQVVDLVNAERAKEGLAALTIDKNVEAAALVRAKEIQTSFSHTRPNGTSFSTALNESSAVFRGAGENIAWGQKTPQEVVAAWMNSPGHRANIMNKSFTKIGVGHLKNPAGASYWAQLFTY